MIDPTPVPRGLRVSAAYGWRILVLAAAGYVILNILGRLELVVVSVFVGLIIAALVAPVVRVLRGFMPRSLAVALGLIALIAVIVAVGAYITGSVAGEWSNLIDQTRNGIREIEVFLEESPLHVSSNDFTDWYDRGRVWFIDHRGELAQNALGSAGTLLEIFAGLALAIFCAVCFLVSGDRIWRFLTGLFPKRVRARLDGAGYVAWRSFAGYTRGIIVVAAANAAFVCIMLLILRVPLAVPLALLVFFGTFIPLIGAPIAMLISVVVALATRGPLIAVFVLAGIFLLGQLEGHVLQPLVMSKAVNIHPLAVALAVTCGTLLAGLLGAVIAVPVVSVIYGVGKFWVQTAPPDDYEPTADPTGTGAAAATGG